MSTALAVPAPQWEDPKLIQTIKETVCKGATDAQFRMFVEVCKATGLNPFLKEIWFVPSVGVMAGRDAYLKKANEHPQFDGMETRVERDEKNIPIKAVCTVWRKDRGHPVIAEAFYNEYRKGGNVWNTYPSAMIAKVAEVLALKRSFAINGVVTEEEIGNSEERGSKSAQQEYLRSRGINPDASPSEERRETLALVDGMDKPKPIEEITARKQKQESEAEAIVKEEKTRRGKAKADAPAVSFDMLHAFKEVKGLLHAETGSDSLYYEVLGQAGYSKSSDIKTREEGTRTYRMLAAALNRLKEIRVQREEVLELWGQIDNSEFMRVMGSHGEDDVTNIRPESLPALLSELRGIAPK